MDVMAIFARELIGKDVVDSHNETLGKMTDIVFDVQSGSITTIIVTLEGDLNPNLLPWDEDSGKVMIPVDDVSRFSKKIHLKK
ncbi:MAG: PRC-barrel domain containing protein [Candidatus Poseidoniales archaeon]|nr:MAG: PRC-barrel domain containing protein [Candidatus Poseidoniales archaeon]